MTREEAHAMPEADLVARLEDLRVAFVVVPTFGYMRVVDASGATVGAFVLADAWCEICPWHGGGEAATLAHLREAHGYRVIG